MRLRLKLPRLLELMAGSTLSQNHWAIKVGLSRGHWSEIVNGRHPYPSAKTRGLMLDAFKVPVEMLFEIEAGVAPWADVDFRRAIADRYLVDTEVGQGGMGAVYLARDVRHGRLVAVKVISPEAVSGIGLTQFHREIATVAQLHHAHGERVLHCDVKPANVLLHGDHPWVMDFGIARKLRSEAPEWARPEGLDLSAGTPAYVSPEQAAGEPDLDARSDVYSLGCMVYEMLAGRPPFEGATTQAIVASRFIVPPPPVRDYAPEVPAAVQAVLERAMSLPRERRPATPVALAGELDRASAGASRVVAAVSLAAAQAARGLAGRLHLPATRSFGGLVRDLLTDLAFTWRSLRRAPAYAIVIVLTLGLALGANATMFGIVDRLWLRPPPHIAQPERVHRVHVARFFDGRITRPSASMSYPAFQDLRDRTQSFSAVAAFDAAEVSSGTGEGAQILDAVLVTGRYFELLGVRPAVGRFFGEEEDRMPAGERVAVLGHAFWTAQYGGDQRAIGRTIQIGGSSFTIVGVAPRGFTGTQLAKVDVFLPMSAAAAAAGQNPEWSTHRGWQFLSVVVRLRDGVAPQVARDDATRAYAAGHAEYREYEARAAASLAPLIAARNRHASGGVPRVAAWLFGMAVIVLLVACANVANLGLARGLSRRGEIAVRRALGVGAGRLVRQFATESLILAGVGGLAGLALAFWGGDLVRALLFPGTTWDAPPLDVRVLALTAGATVTAALAAGVLPLIQGSRGDLAQALHGAARRAVGHPRRLLTTLLLVQTGLTTVLLIGAGLFVRSLHRVQSLDLGFSPRQLLHVRVNFDQSRTSPPERTAFYRLAAQRLQATPGLAGVGLSVGAPFLGNYATQLSIPGFDSIPALGGGGPYFFRISAGTLEALGARLLGGRLLTSADDQPGAAPVAVISERMARTLWPSGDPLVHCLIVDGPPCAPIVGVVADLHRQGLTETPFMLYFMPLATSGDEPPNAMLVRTAGPPARAIETVRREMLALRGDLPYLTIEPYEDLIAPQARSWRLGATMFTAFGALSLLIAAIGVYGVLSFIVTQRTPELGIRAALGATPGRVLRMVLAGGLLAAGGGVLLGAGVAVALSRRLETLLFETSGRDPLTFVVAAATIVLVAFAASLAPGLRAARLDPLQALRAE